MAADKLLVVLLGFLAVFAQAKNLPQQSKIVNGVPVELGEIPYQVGLIRSGSLFCGGSLIKRDYVVTAAHCVTLQSASGIEVQTGMVDLKNPQIRRNVKKIIIHEDYNERDSWKNDIALLKLQDPIPITTTVNYISLPEAGWTVAANERAVVSGWGRLSFNGVLPQFLQKASVVITSQSYCRDVWGGPGGYTVRDSQICAKDANTNKGFCNGDSGGPLTVNRTLVGIVSWGNLCVNAKYPNVYTRVSSFVDWIRTHAV